MKSDENNNHAHTHTKIKSDQVKIDSFSIYFRFSPYPFFKITLRVPFAVFLSFVQAYRSDFFSILGKGSFGCVSATCKCIFYLWNRHINTLIEAWILFSYHLKTIFGSNKIKKQIRCLYVFFFYKVTHQ